MDNHNSQVVSNPELEHQNDLYGVFSKPEWEPIQEELQKYKDSVMSYITGLNPLLPEHQAAYLRYQGQLDLIDLLLKLPEENRGVLQVIKEALIKFVR